MGLHPIVKPFGLVLVVFGIIQGLLWIVGSFIGILASTKAVDFRGNARHFVDMVFYYVYEICLDDTDLSNTMTINSTGFLACLVLYLLFSLAWLILSLCLWRLVYSGTWRTVQKFLIAWSVVAGLSTLLDISLTIAYAIDYTKYVNSWNDTVNQNKEPLPFYRVQILTMGIIMSVAARGYVLLCLNILLICTSLIVVFKQEVMESPMYDPKRATQYGIAPVIPTPRMEQLSAPMTQTVNQPWDEGQDNRAYVNDQDNDDDFLSTPSLARNRSFQYPSVNAYYSESKSQVRGSPEQEYSQVEGSPREEPTEVVTKDGIKILEPYIPPADYSPPSSPKVRARPVLKSNPIYS